MWRLSLLLAMLAPGACARAQQVCPWLTQGTAAALMGGAVSVSVHGSAAEGTCEFLRKPRGDRSAANMGSGLRMKIVVAHTASRACAGGEPLRGIGEDAVVCIADADGQHREVLHARVRTTFFQISLATGDTSPSGKALLRRSLQQLGEEVAGNLF